MIQSAIQPSSALLSRSFQDLSNSFSIALKKSLAFGSTCCNIPAKSFIQFKRTNGSARSKKSLVISSLVDLCSFKSSSMVSLSPKSYKVFFPRLEKSVLMSFMMVSCRLLKRVRFTSCNISCFTRFRKRIGIEKSRKRLVCNIIGVSLEIYC